MKVSPHADDVRRLVVRTFQSYGAGQEEIVQMSDTILIQDGHFYGRSYRTGSLMAMWLVSVGLLQFYAADGTMLHTINLLRDLHLAAA